MSIDSNRFSKEAKAALKVGSDVSSGGLVWRKQPDGTGIWRYDFTLNGNRCRGTIGPESSGINLSAAKRIFENARKQAFLNKYEPKLNPRYGDKAFNEVAQQYLEHSINTKRSYWDDESRARQHLVPFFGAKVFRDITLQDIEDLINVLRGKNLKNSTINRIIYLLSAMHEHAIKRDETVRNLVNQIDKLDEGIPQVEVFTDEEVTKLFAAAGRNTTYQVILGLARYAGLRAAEALGLEWKHVDLKNRTLHICQTAMEGIIIKNTKSGKARPLYISDDLYVLLVNHKQTRPSEGLVASSRDGKPYHHVQKIFSQLRKKAGLGTGRGYHVLRHTFATKAGEQGNAWALQRALGHADIKTTERYVHMSAPHIKAMIERMDAHPSG